MAKPKKPVPAKVRIIGREEKDAKGGPYGILDALVKEHHQDLAEAEIALAWHLSWTADPDGHLRLGKARKAAEVDRRLHEFDFVILLNREVWHMPTWDEAAMKALLDHELCHCTVRKDKNGDPVRDEDGRPVWRVRRHDVEEFAEVVARHGPWKADLEHVVRLALEKQKDPLFQATAEKRKAARTDDFSQQPSAVSPEKWAATAGGLADDPKFLGAVRDLCPKPGGNLTSITFSTPGEKPVVLTAETRDRIKKRLAKRGKA